VRAVRCRKKGSTRRGKRGRQADETRLPTTPRFTYPSCWSGLGLGVKQEVACCPGRSLEGALEGMVLRRCRWWRGVRLRRAEFESSRCCLGGRACSGAVVAVWWWWCSGETRPEAERRTSSLLRQQKKERPAGLCSACVKPTASTPYLSVSSPTHAHCTQFNPPTTHHHRNSCQMAAGFLQALLEKGGYGGGGDDSLLLPLAVTGLCVLGGM